MVSVQFGGSPIKVGEEDYTLFRDSEYVSSASHCVYRILILLLASLPRSVASKSDSLSSLSFPGLFSPLVLGCKIVRDELWKDVYYIIQL